MLNVTFPAASVGLTTSQDPWQRCTEGHWQRLINTVAPGTGALAASRTATWNAKSPLGQTIKHGSTTLVAGLGTAALAGREQRRAAPSGIRSSNRERMSNLLEMWSRTPFRVGDGPLGGGHSAYFPDTRLSPSRAWDGGGLAQAEIPPNRWDGWSCGP